MGRQLLRGTKMDVAQDARDVSLTLTEENMVLELDQNSEGRSTNTQLQLQNAVSEPVESSIVEESAEPKDDMVETDGAAAGFEGNQILTAETNKQTVSDESVTMRFFPVVSFGEFRTGDGQAAEGRLSRETGSTSSRMNDTDGARTNEELELGLKARADQLGVSANNKRPAVSSPHTGLPLWWDANRLADPRESKRSCDQMNRNLQDGNNHASMGPNFSRWELINCETRTEEPHSAQCLLIDLGVEGNSEDSTSSMPVDPVRISPSREMSPEPNVIPLEERQEQLHRQAIEMRMRSNRTRPTPVPRPVNDSSATCSQSDLLSWIRRDRRTAAPDRDVTERYNFDVHRDLPLTEGRWEWENVQQP